MTSKSNSKTDREKARKIAEAKNSMSKPGQPHAFKVMAGFEDRVEREKLLPDIQPSDLEFAKEIYNKYPKLNEQDLCRVIRDVRYIIKKYQSDFDHGLLSMDQNFWDKLCSDGIKSITVNSDKGAIEIEADSILFDHYFRLQLKKIRILHHEVIEMQRKEFRYYLVDLPFIRIWRFLNKSNLGPSQKRVVAGKFLVHFNIYKYKPIMTEEQWNAKSNGFSTYLRYLSDIIDTWLNSL